MKERLAVLAVVAAIVSAAGINCAAEPSHGIDAASLRPGVSVRIRTASRVDLPGVVKMQVVGGSLQTTLQGQIVKQSDKTLTVCPPGCTAPVVVPKPNVTFTGVVLGVESGVARIELDTEPREVAMLPVASIADLGGEGSLLGGRGAGLVGKHVAVEVGAIVELPSDTSEARPAAVRDVVIDGTRLTEVRTAGHEAPLLVPPPKGHLEGNVAAADSDTLTVRLLGHSQIVTVPRAAITSLRVRQSRTHAGKGALIGAGVGLAAGLGLVIAIESGSCGGEDRALCSFFDVASTVVTTAGGTLIGAVAGGMTHTDRWERVDPRKLSVAVMPDPHGGIRGRLAIRF
jgi:hypothetical protein